MSNNKNNFLRWSGNSTVPSFTISPVGNICYLFANLDSVIGNPLALCSASNGINTYSFEIKSIINPITGLDVELSQQCEWDGISNLTIFRPIDLSLTVFDIYFTFKDFLGNISNSVRLRVVVDTISVTWIPYTPSQYCVLDSFGNNTGYSGWTQLVLVNSITLTPVTPFQLKDNISADPSYYPPVTDYVTCPAPVLPYSNLYISNFSQNGADPNPNNTITIINIYLYSATMGVGGTPIALNIPVNIPNGNTLRLNVPSGTWDSISISFNVTTGGNMDFCVPIRYWKANSAGVVIGFGPTGTGLADNPVDNSGILSGVGITIPPASSGITVFCQ